MLLASGGWLLAFPLCGISLRSTGFWPNRVVWGVKIVRGGMKGKDRFEKGLGWKRAQV